MMTHIEFWDSLREKNGYDTPEPYPSPLPDRCFGRLDSWYKLRVMGRILVTAWRARNHHFTVDSWGPLTYAIWRVVESCDGRISVRGVENLKKLDGPAVYVSNHMSMIETVILPSIVLPFGLITLVVKESLTRYPVFGTIMRAVRPIAVTRTDPREDFRRVMEQGERIIRQEGRSVIIFPQATRSPTFRPNEFNSLGAKLARKAEVPLVPLALKTDFHGIGRRIRDFGPVDRSKRLHFAFGEPMRVTGNGRAEHQKVVDFIALHLRQWGGVVEDIEGT